MSVQAGITFIYTLYFVYLRYRHNVQAGHGHLHVCMQIDHRQLQALGTYNKLYSRKPHPLYEGCSFREYLHYRYLQIMYNSKSLLQTDVFRASYLCSFTISDFGELQCLYTKPISRLVIT